MQKPPSPKIDPRTGMDIASALHIDHDPPVQNTGPVFNSMIDPGGIGLNQPPQNPYLPSDMEQTPSDFSYGNHSDAGYLSTPGSGIHGNNMSAGQYNNNNNQYNAHFQGGMGRGGFGNRNHMGFGKGSNAYGNGPNASSNFGNTPGSSSFTGSTPASSFGNTPLSFDSGVPPTPVTPQTPQPPMKNDFNMNENRRGRNGPRERRDSYNNSYNNRERRDSYNKRDRNNKESDWGNRHRNNDWGRERFGRDHDRNRRDGRNERDNWNRERDNRNNRYRDRERDRNRNDRGDFRNNRDNEISTPRNKPNDLAPVFPPPPPPEEEIRAPAPIFTPPPVPQPPPVTLPPPPQTQTTPEKKEEEDTRSMSLDSRIQSLLSGFKSPEPARPKTPPPAVKQTPPGHSPATHIFDSSSQGHVGNIPVPQDDDDRMSLDSTGSGGEPGAIEVNQTNTAVPPPLVMPSSEMPNSTTQVMNWQQQNDLQNNYMPPGYMNNFSAGQYNQNFVNQMNNEMNDQRFVNDPKEEADKHEITFTDVLENFVKELKDIMCKDLCKKMVETSAFKTYETWWDREEEKTKV